jgi:hypothetical protein
VSNPGSAHRNREAAIRIIGKSVYPTAWGGAAVIYEPNSALSHAREAVRQLEQAGYKIVPA